MNLTMPKSMLTATICLHLFACTQDKDKGATYTLASESSLTTTQKGQVVARIGERLITLEEFEEQLNEKSPFVRARYNSASRKREFLDSLVRFELLALAAEKKGYGDDPDVVLAKKQAMVRRFVAKEVAQLVKMGDVTDQEIQTYYDAHEEDYQRPEQVRASHMVTGDEMQAKSILDRVNAATKQPGVDPVKAFESLLKTLKKRSKPDQHQGDLGFFAEPGVRFTKRPQNAPLVPPAVAKAAFALSKVGDVHAQPIKTSQGWHIVQKTGFRRAHNQTVSAVRNKIRNAVFRQKKTKAMRAYVDELRKKAKIEINDEVLKKVRAKRQIAPPPSFGPPKLPSFKPAGDVNQ